MFTSPKSFKEALARHPYPGIDRDADRPHPGSFVGYFFDDILPTALKERAIEFKSKGLSAAVGERFVSMTSGFQYGWPFYPMAHPQACLLQVAATKPDYERMRYQKPTRIASFIRQGEARNYLTYLSGENAALSPLFTYFYCATTAEMEAAYAQIKPLLENRRIGVIVTPSNPDADFRALAKSGLRATITLVDGSVSVPEAAWGTAMGYSKLSSEPHSAPGAEEFSFHDITLLFFGTGTTHKAFKLSAPTFEALGKWNTAFDYVAKFVVDATLPTDFVNAHIAAVKAHIEAHEVLVPHLDSYPEPPALAHLGAITLNQRLKTRSDPLTEALLNYDNATLQLFNPVVGRETGIIDAMLSRPALLSRNITDTQASLEKMGYRMELTTQQIEQLDRRRRFFDLQISPLKPVSGLECLAYYQPARYRCKKTIYNPETRDAVWTTGREYNITPNWRKESFPGGSEPIVDTEGKIVGVEDFTIRYSVLALEVETNGATAKIAENACREMLEEEKAAEAKVDKTKKDAVTKPVKPPAPWEPLLDEFLQAFDLPKVPTVLDLKPDAFKAMRTRILARLPHLKGYQADLAVLNAMKRGGILGSEMGAGKTYQAIAVLLLRGKAFNLIVVPPMLVPQWLKALQDCKVWARSLLTHGAVNKLERHFKRIQGATPAEKKRMMFAEQECYVTTPEFLSLGGQGNKVYDPWLASYSTMLPAHPKGHLQRIRTEIQGTRYHVGSEVQALSLASHQTHQFSGIVKKCPKCARERADGFSASGVCRCGYRAFSFVGTRKRVTASGLAAKDWIFSDNAEIPAFIDQREPELEAPALATEYAEDVAKYDGQMHVIRSSGTPKEVPKVMKKLTSDYFHPAYRRLKKVFGLKIIDEVHLIANLDCAKGAAVYAIHADETFVMSGTISRGYVTDIESALAHVHEADTPCFPFAPWNRRAFKEQFITERVKVTTYLDGTKGKSSATMVPEASNVNRLRRMLNCVTTRADEAMLEAEWKLPPPTRRYVEVKLKPANQAYYNKVLAGVAEWYKYASKTDRQRSAMSQLWELRHICENEEKLDVIADFVRQWVREGHKFVIVTPTKFMYQAIRDMLEGFGLRILAVDDSTAPERRQELTSLFSDTLYHGLVSRTKLVCTGLNTLVHADRLIIAGPEYHPATIRQMEKRLIRPGQKSNRVEIIYPIVRMSPRPSVEEEMLKLLLLKEASVNEVTKGKVRWVKPAMLVESAMESKGAARVLEALAGGKDTRIGDMDLDNLFAELVEAVAPLPVQDMGLEAILAPSADEEDPLLIQPLVTIE